KREAIESDDLRETLDHPSYVVECVFELLSRRHVGLTEAGKVRRDHVKFFGEPWNQFPEHVSRGRKAVQEKQLRRIDILRLAIENFGAVDRDCTVSDWTHQTLLCSHSISHTDQSDLPTSSSNSTTRSGAVAIGV